MALVFRNEERQKARGGGCVARAGGRTAAVADGGLFRRAGRHPRIRQLGCGVPGDRILRDGVLGEMAGSPPRSASCWRSCCGVGSSSSRSESPRSRRDDHHCDRNSRPPDVAISRRGPGARLAHGWSRGRGGRVVQPGVGLHQADRAAAARRGARRGLPARASRARGNDPVGVDQRPGRRQLDRIEPVRLRLRRVHVLRHADRSARSCRAWSAAAWGRSRRWRCCSRVPR